MLELYEDRSNRKYMTILDMNVVIRLEKSSPSVEN